MKHIANLVWCNLDFIEEKLYRVSWDTEKFDGKVLIDERGHPRGAVVGNADFIERILTRGFTFTQVKHVKIFHNSMGTWKVTKIKYNLMIHLHTAIIKPDYTLSDIDEPKMP